MARRTNAFQKAIYYIHDQLKDSDAIVTESAEIEESKVDTIIKREIDILIEKKTDDKIFRIAIECRDRTSVDDIQWIDCLVGKYINLPVDRIIAVSKSGFSRNANKKAVASGIELRTLKEISALDWKIEYEKLGFSEVNMTFKIDKFQLEIEDNQQFKITPDEIVSFMGEEITIGTLISWYLEAGFWDQVIKAFKNKFSSVYKTRQDIDKSALLIKEILLKDVKIILQDKPHNLRSIKVFVLGIPLVKDATVTTFSYEDSYISTTKLDGNKQHEEINFYITQAQPENEIQVSYEKKGKGLKTHTKRKN